MLIDNTHHGCTQWALWSYRVQLTQPLAVLGEDALHRTGWIIGQCNPLSGRWRYGEIALLPSFHPYTKDEILNDIHQVFQQHQSPRTPLVQNVLDIWAVSAQQGSVHINSLLNSKTIVSNSETQTIKCKTIKSKTIKYKLGRRSLEEDCRTFSQLQQAHPSVRWRLDCNRQWNLQELHHFWTVCHANRVDYIEDPLQDPNDMALAPTIPFALDESLLSHSHLLSLPNVIAAVIKPTLHLGWQRLLQKHDVQAIISSTFEGSLGLWGLGQLALHHLPKGIHGLGTLGWFAEECVVPPLQTSSSRLYIPLAPPKPNFSMLTWEMGQ